MQQIQMKELNPKIDGNENILDEAFTQARAKHLDTFNEISEVVNKVHGVMLENVKEYAQYEWIHSHEDSHIQLYERKTYERKFYNL